MISMGFSYRYKKALRTNKERNESEINSIRDGFVDNMKRAMYNHIQTVKTGSQHDVLSVSRLVAIWFENETRLDIREQVKVRSYMMYAICIIRIYI